MVIGCNSSDNTNSSTNCNNLNKLYFLRTYERENYLFNLQHNYISLVIVINHFQASNAINYTIIDNWTIWSLIITSKPLFSSRHLYYLEVFMILFLARQHKTNLVNTNVHLSICVEQQIYKCNQLQHCIADYIAQWEFGRPLSIEDRSEASVQGK